VKSVTSIHLKALSTQLERIVLRRSAQELSDFLNSTDYKGPVVGLLWLKNTGNYRGPLLYTPVFTWWTEGTLEESQLPYKRKYYKFRLLQKFLIVEKELF
jgi:hypothetical protein